MGVSGDFWRARGIGGAAAWMTTRGREEGRFRFLTRCRRGDESWRERVGVGMRRGLPGGRKGLGRDGEEGGKDGGVCPVGEVVVVPFFLFGATMLYRCSPLSWDRRRGCGCAFVRAWVCVPVRASVCLVCLPAGRSPLSVPQPPTIPPSLPPCHPACSPSFLSLDCLHTFVLLLLITWVWVRACLPAFVWVYVRGEHF